MEIIATKLFCTHVQLQYVISQWVWLTHTPVQ